MKKHSKLLLILMLIFNISFLAFLAFKFILGEVLLPKSQVNYTIYTHKNSLEPITELYVQKTSGSDLLLKGKDIWILTLDSNDSVTYGETIYYFDIKKQVVSVYGQDKNKETIKKEVPADSVKGITLHKDGIILTSKEKRVFSMEKGKNYDITLQNISDKPLTFTIEQVFR